MVHTDILLQNAQKMFDDWFKDTKHPSGHIPQWDKQPDHIKGIFITWAKSGKLFVDKVGYYFTPQKDTARHPYFRSVEHRIDWKDFRYSVVRTGTMITGNESMYQAIGSFEAWLEQEVYCIKDYQPSGYLNTKDNIYSYKVIKLDGMSSKTYTFAEYSKALKYARTCSVQQAKCHQVVFEIYLQHKLIYTISARKKSPMELVPKQEDEEVTDAGPVPQPKLKMISGGMDGFGEDNWLEALPEGTVFHCIRKGGGEFIAMQFQVIRKWKKTCHLHSNFPVQQTGDLIAHYGYFSAKHERLEVLLWAKDWIRENEDAGRRDEKEKLSVDQSDIHLSE